jgi:hypothetical protein
MKGSIMTRRRMFGSSSSRRVRFLVAAVAACGLLISPVSARADANHSTTIVNGTVAGATFRFDVKGNAIDAHDGQIQRFGDTYYLYGTSYGCGYVRMERPATPWCGFKVYSSPDLTHWTDRGYLFDPNTAAWQARCNSATLSCYRPHVVYNRTTGKYVLWVNTYDIPVDYHVFTADSPVGPFTEVATPTLAINGGGDMDLFVDTDGTAYLAHSVASGGYDIAVEKLDASYTSGTGQAVKLGMTHVEAPSMFKRNGIYYLVISDPYCAYCAGTGASYLTAPTPLGPWHTVLRSDVPTDNGQMYLNGIQTLTNVGADWSDYDYSFNTIPYQTGHGGQYAQAGWYFRAQDLSNTYAWIIGNYPYPGNGGGSLTKVRYVGGKITWIQTVKLPFPIVAGQQYAVKTSVRGSTFTTYVNGQLVDTTTDSTFASGRVGLREDTGESARFSDAKVTAPDGTVLFADDFSNGTSQWQGLTRPRGIPISDNSCGGQPDDVAVLPAPGGPVYLFQSDRWNNGDQNEALATRYWEPLRFGPDGSILPLQCANSYSLTLAGLHQGHDNPPVNLDQTSGSAGFRSFCDVRASVTRAQTFTAGRTGTLDRVAVTAFQDNHPNGALTLSVAALDTAGQPGPVLWSSTVPATAVSWSPAEVAGEPSIPVVSGRQYVVQISAPATTSGCYGFVYNDGDPYAGGGALYSSDAGQTWTPEAGRDLKFETSVAAGA